MTPAAGLRDGAAARSGSTKLKPKSRNVLLSLGALVLAPMAAVALALVVSPDALLHARNGIGAIVETAALRHMKEDGKTADPVEVVSWQPRAFVWRKFLSDSECEHIKQISRPYLRRSKVVDNQAGGEREDPIRTSNGTFVPRRRDDVISRVEDRVAKFTGLPVAHQEDLQVLSYGATDQYKDHMDTLGSRNEPGAGERTMSVLMYLADVDEGGETVFPKSDHWADERMKPQSASLSACARRGVSVKPRKGDALLFHDLTPTNEIDPLSMHASCPVINGLKWTGVQHLAPQQVITSLSLLSVSTPLQACLPFQDKLLT